LGAFLRVPPAVRAARTTGYRVSVQKN